MEVDIDVDNGVLHVRQPEALLLDIDPGPGWYGSSQALRRGLDIVECDGLATDADGRVEAFEAADLARLFGR